MRRQPGGRGTKTSEHGWRRATINLTAQESEALARHLDTSTTDGNHFCPDCARGGEWDDLPALRSVRGKLAASAGPS